MELVTVTAKDFMTSQLSPDGLILTLTDLADVEAWLSQPQLRFNQANNSLVSLDLLAFPDQNQLVSLLRQMTGEGWNNWQVNGKFFWLDAGSLIAPANATAEEVLFLQRVEPNLSLLSIYSLINQYFQEMGSPSALINLTSADLKQLDPKYLPFLLSEQELASLTLIPTGLMTEPLLAKLIARALPLSQELRQVLATDNLLTDPEFGLEDQTASQSRRLLVSNQSTDLTIEDSPEAISDGNLTSNVSDSALNLLAGYLLTKVPFYQRVNPSLQAKLAVEEYLLAL